MLGETSRSVNCLHDDIDPKNHMGVGPGRMTNRYATTCGSANCLRNRIGGAGLARDEDPVPVAGDDELVKPKMDRPEVTRSFAQRRLDGQSFI